jgi:hypothetical protein
MMHVRTNLVFALAGVGVALAPAVQAADPPTIQSGTLVKSVVPEHGFIDDPFAFDGAGGRLAYVSADAASHAEIIVLDLAQRAQLMSVDISAFTTAPIEIEFALAGDHFFVIEQPGKTGPKRAALMSASGKIVRTFGPADDIVRAVVADQAAVVLYTTSEARAKRRPKFVQHTVEVRGLATGKRIGKRTTLSTDLTGHSKQLDFTFRYWANGYTSAVGIKGGTWDRREDQRSPDAEGWYDMPTRKFSRQMKIENVVDHTKRMQELSGHPNESAFLEVAQDLSGIRLVSEDKPTASVSLDIPFHRYDRTTLRYRRSADGGFLFPLAVDPVNPDAVARKRADKVWLDLYELAPGATKAKRRARLHLADKRDVMWRATNRYWAVVPRHVGFDRGGK